MNRTIVEMARTLLSEGNLPLMYWCFAVSYAAYIINRSPTRTLESKTPHEAYTRNKPSVAHLRIFGCKAYVHIPQEKRQKLDKKTLECAYLGYSEHKKAFILLYRSSGHLVESRDVHFDESELVEPSRVIIETEVGKNEEEVEILPDQKNKDIESDTSLPEDAPENPPGESNDDDDKNEFDAPSEDHKTTGESSSQYRPSLMPDNNGKHSNESRMVSCTKRSSPMDSATQRTSHTTTTHPLNTRNAPATPNSNPSTLSNPPCRSGRERKAPVQDDDSRYLVTLYGSRQMQDLGKKKRDEREQAGSSEGEGRRMNVTPVTDKSAKTAVLENSISYHDALSWDDRDKWEEACKHELETFKKMEVYCYDFSICPPPVVLLSLPTCFIVIPWTCCFTSSFLLSSMLVLSYVLLLVLSLVSSLT